MTDKNHTKFEEKELRFRQTLSALPDGVVLLRKDLVIQWMNRIAERDLSLDPEKDVGKKLTDVFTNPEFIQHIQSERWKARQLIDLPDGRVLEVRVISAGKKYTVVVTRDITESKRIDDFRRDFVGNVSHELRTPLTVIQGFLELATENPNLNEEDRLHWEMMLEQAERMRALVDDLLALSRLEQDAAPASRELIDVDEILEEAAAEGRMISGGAHEIKIAKDDITRWQNEKAACDAIIKKWHEGITETVSGNEVIGVVSQEEFDVATANSARYQELINEKQAFINNNPDKVKAYEDKVKALSDAQKALSDKGNSKENSSNSLEVQKNNWAAELTKRKAQLDVATATRDQLLTDISNELNLDYKLDDLQKQRDEIAKLQENAVGASIEAPISGTITSVTVKAGDEAQPDTALVTMQPEGKGFTMSFSVTNDQAKRLSVGDKADLVNSWRYSDMDITLASIKPDTTDPGQKKLLTFDITGDEVTPGQSLNVSVGQKSANYDLIVPNSAIREDSNGKFILIVESKSSPLGNRYVATRVDVEVLASDDTQSAVSGALYGSEFVITTSTQPVEAGKLVRLANNS